MLKKFFRKASIEGLHLPFVHDPVSGKPSITLLFPYFTFLIAVVSIVASHFYTGMIIATWTSIFFWVISVVFYMIRKLHKSKINLEEKSIELISEESEEE